MYHAEQSFEREGRTAVHLSFSAVYGGSKRGWLYSHPPRDKRGRGALDGAESLLASWQSGCSSLLHTPTPSVPQGIWRIPVDEIDRPGSFAWHMNRSIVLLLKVLAQLRDHSTLLKVSSMLQRTPDQGK